MYSLESGVKLDMSSNGFSGTCPAEQAFEERPLAFLDVGPLSDGHTLVIPKERVATLHELGDDAAAALGRVLPRLCRAVLAATGATAYNVLQNNGAAAHQAVLHVHFHIIPRFESTGLEIAWKAGSLDEARADEIAKNIREAIRSEEL